ncbi:putative DNA repair protein MutK [Chryseobacterium sp. MDT2-18]|nr:putative DNA repair protein MutK [Chryseobacterium sp. MDT2-18]
MSHCKIINENIFQNSLFLSQNKKEMASGFFAVLDDIAALMDDVAAASKVATKQTAGILGDDLAVNAEKATGFLSSREIPVLWAITKGSFINKLIIIPVAFLLQVIFPPAIKIILILGGLYLAYEGVEKIIEYFFHKEDKHVELAAETENGENAEKIKVKSAITTDFILSLEIVIIALGSVLEKSLPIQIITVSVVAFLATVGVYGIVALIVRMDDAGYKLIRKSNNKGFLTFFGNLLVKALPLIIKALSIIGTIALLLVSGGIFDHNIEWVHQFLPHFTEMVKHLLYGIIAGLLVFFIISGIKKGISLIQKQ